MNNKVGVVIVCLFVALVAITWNTKAQSQANSSQEIWEYKIVHLATLAGIESVEDAVAKAFGEKGVLSQGFKAAEAFNTEISGRMNQLGKEGWELVCFQEDTGFLFKRKQ